MNIRRTLVAVGAALGAIVGSLALFDVPPAAAAYASNGEPVWIPRDAANTADLLRADNHALAKIGNVVYVGGDFTELAPALGAPAVEQGYLAAFNATTGVPIPAFAPRLDGKVYALAASDDGTTLYVGGSFTTVNGQLIGGFATLDASTGALKAGVTQRSTDGEVHAIYKDGSALYVGGQFQKFGGTNNRKMMAKLDISTPAQTVNATFAPQFVGGLVAAIDIPPDHSRVYAGGRFTTLDGTAVGKIVALSPSSGAVDAGFAPPFNTTKQPVEDIEAINTKVFVAFGGGYNRFVQFAASGSQEYGSCGDGDVQEVHLVNNGTLLLVGGHFAGSPKKNCTLDTIPTARIAEYQVNDVAGALPVVVNPTPFPNVYANDLGVWEFLGSSLTDVWVAGDFLKVSSRNTGGLAHFFDGPTYTDGQSPSIPGNVQVAGATPGSLTVTWSASTDNKGVAGYFLSVDGVPRATAIGTAAVVSGLAPGVTYNVQVQAFDVKLNVSALSTGVPGSTLVDTSAPSAPTNLRVLNGGTTELVLGWNAALDNGTVTEYLVYADGNLLGTTGGLTLAHSGLTPGSQHGYEVVAKDAGGNVSLPSATLTARAYSVLLPTGATWKYRDQGALADFSWREAAYDDSTWSSGPAPLGYGRSYVATPIGWGPSISNRYLTSYARTTFNLADPSGIAGLALRLRGTDGAAVFINGKLAYNDNLPAALEPDLGALTARETSALDIVREFRVPVTTGMLVAGPNVVAVEFHKYAPNSSYLGFAVELSMDAPSVVQPPLDPPAHLVATLVAGPGVQLSWDAVNGTTSYAVLRNGALLTAVASPGYTDPAPGTGTITYTVRAIDSIGQQSTDSTPASVTITSPPPPDTVKPSRPGQPVTGAVTDTTAAFSWAPSTDNVGVTGYRIYRNGAVVTTSPTPSFTDAGLAPSTAYRYQVTAFDAANNESAKSGALNVTAAAPSSGGVVSPTTSWSYTETRVDLGTTWKDAGYVVAGPLWKSGLPQLGFGDGDEATVIGRGGSTSGTGVITWYFRTTFDVADPTGMSLVANLIRDDGAVVYLNGVEVFRSNLPAGAVSYTTRALGSVGGADEETPLPFTVPPGALVTGPNVIAVELHNAGPTNGDASFQLTASLS